MPLPRDIKGDEPVAYYLKIIAEELIKIRKEISYANTTRRDNINGSN